MSDQQRITMLREALKTLIGFDSLFDIQSRLSDQRADAWNGYILMVLELLKQEKDHER